MSTKRDRKMMSKLDARAHFCRSMIGSWFDGGELASEFARIDARRRALRLKIKQYKPGRGVGGSARRGTPRSVGSSPTAPTIQQTKESR